MTPFPFTAVVAQDAVKSALLLSVIDPKIGGVLISGTRGSAKSTLVRSLQSLLPEQPLVTLPLGASEERITGSIDLQQALENNDIRFSPGLLARAHGGVLYVDEVNLLADPLVDLLLDVCASGVNRVERDGISHHHDAHFVLVGTMNPDEGELRPQLLDRFGLIAPVQTLFTLEQRRQIVAERLAHDDDAATHANMHEPALLPLRNRVVQARAGLGSVLMSEAVLNSIAERCKRADVDGLRADITLYRACRAHAALHQRSAATIEDLDAVEELVLAHRRSISVEPPQPPSPGASSHSATEGSPGDDTGRGSGNGSSHTPDSDNEGSGKPQRSQNPGSSIQGSWGAMPPVKTLAHAPIAPPHHVPSSPTRAKPRDARSAERRSERHGPFASRQTQPGGLRAEGYRPDWFRTLTDRENLAGLLQRTPRRHLYWRCPAPASRHIELVLLDTSASTLAGQGLAKAKGVIRHLAHQAYLNRRRLALITFGNDRVDTVLMARRSPKNVEALLNTLSAGGGTPLTKVLAFADRRISQWQSGGARVNLHILTDGRVALPATQFRTPADSCTLIDIDSDRVRANLGQRLATVLGARYWHVDR